MIRLAATAFDPAAELAAFASPGAGAIASFTGFVRDEGDAVTALDLDHHPLLTPRSLETIAADTRARFDLLDLLVIHRHGRVLAGDPIVLVAAAAHHRRAAFNAVDYAMDRLKLDAIFWKKERRADGDRWIEARSDDHAAAARWEPTG